MFYKLGQSVCQVADTIFDKIHQLMPGYDCVYLGDNAFSYGTRSFEVVYQFTRQAL